jgi:hypothetical protein
VPVTLAARATAIGTLELFCVAREGNNRWRLEFNIRDLVKEVPTRKEAGDEEERTVTEVWLEQQVQLAGRLIRLMYMGKADPEPPPTPAEIALAPRDLTKALENALDAPRHEWPTALCRRLWEYLAEVADERRRTPAHLSRWYNLAGYCLRPGFGDALDKFRIEQLWKIMVAPARTDGGQRSGAPRILESGADVWILWRRVAGGLSLSLQQALYDRLRPALLPTKGKASIKPNANELAEMWRAAASFERLDVKHKEALGNALLKSLRRSPVPTHAFWALTRLGARSLIYGPLNAVVHPEVAAAWLDAIVGFEPGNQSEVMAWAFCLAQLARLTGQRALDLDDSRRRSVLTALRGQEIPRHWVRMVEEVTELEHDEQGQMLGDSLPIGLRLLRSED